MPFIPCDLLSKVSAGVGDRFTASLRDELIARLAENSHGKRLLEELRGKDGGHALPDIRLSPRVSANYIAEYHHGEDRVEFNRYAIQPSLAPREFPCLEENPSYRRSPLAGPLRFGLGGADSIPQAERIKRFEALLASPAAAKILAIALAPAFYHELTHARQYRQFKPQAPLPTEFEVEALLDEIAFTAEEMRKDEAHYIARIDDPVVSFHVAKARGAVVRSIDEIKSEVLRSYSAAGMISLDDWIAMNRETEGANLLRLHYVVYYAGQGVRWPRLCARLSALLSRVPDPEKNSSPRADAMPSPPKEPPSMTELRGLQDKMQSAAASKVSGQ